MNRDLPSTVSRVKRLKRECDPSQSGSFLYVYGEMKRLETEAPVSLSLSLNTQGTECTTFTHYMPVNPIDQ